MAEIEENEPNNLKAMFLSYQRGEKLSSEHPEIADLWKSGKTELEIGRMYLQGDQEDVARNAVAHALELLIGKEEMAEISRRHCIEGSIKAGLTTVKRVREAGLDYAWNRLSPEKLAERRHKAGILGGRISGAKLYAERKGMFARTPEEIARDSKKAILKIPFEVLYGRGRHLAIFNGLIPYDTVKMTEQGEMTEKDYIIYLKNSGNLKWRDIAEKVKEVYGNIRSINTLMTMYCKWKKENS